MTYTLDDFVKIFNCISEIQNRAGKVVAGTHIIGLPYRKSFELSVAVKSMKPIADSYQEQVNKVGKDMGLQAINGGAFYVMPDDMSIGKKNEYVKTLDDIRKATVEYEPALIQFTDDDLEGIELNISGASQQVFFEHIYKKKP